jgi:hypothetical protein
MTRILTVAWTRRRVATLEKYRARVTFTEEVKAARQQCCCVNHRREGCWRGLHDTSLHGRQAYVQGSATTENSGAHVADVETGGRPNEMV